MIALPLPLKIYRGALQVLKPVVIGLLQLRKYWGKEDPQRIAERMGQTNIPRPNKPMVWVHAASIGEMLSALPLIEKITLEGFHVLLTTVTRTSSELAKKRLGEHVTHQFVPFDVPQWVEKFLSHWRPQLALFMEQEIWPNTLLELKKQEIPAILINGRLSEKSFSTWSKILQSAATTFNLFDLILAQSDHDAARFLQLSRQAERVHDLGNLKYDVAPLPVNADEFTKLNLLLTPRLLFTAASTHKGEEEEIFSITMQLKAQRPSLLTILAPRHPDRGDAIENLAKTYGLQVARRSKNEWPTADTSVFLFDTIGEMGLIYRLSRIVFMGGSLVPHGGQNPIEPAQLNCAILYGPHIFNFSDVYAAFAKANAAQSVQNAQDLRSALRLFLDDRTVVEQFSNNAKQVVKNMGGALSRTQSVLQPYLSASKEKFYQ